MRSKHPVTAVIFRLFNALLLTALTWASFYTDYPWRGAIVGVFAILAFVRLGALFDANDGVGKNEGTEKKS